MNLFIRWILKIFLMLVELNLNMIEEFFENILIIHYKFINDCSVHILAGKFIWIAIDDFCHSGEMSRNSLSVSLNDKVIIANYNIYELMVVDEIAQKRNKLDFLVIFNPKFQVFVSSRHPFILEYLDCINYSFDEYLKDWIWTLKAFAVLFALLFVQIILL